MDMRVLVADDDPVIRSFVCEFIKSWGFMPEIAEDGDEALKILRSVSPPRIAILDWMMPGMTGVEVCSWLEHNSSTFIYRILLTSRSDKEDLTFALDNGAHQFLNKPIDPDVLRCNLNVAKRLIDSDDALLRIERVAAVGTLAGGIAHQYNNMNAGIMGYIDFLLNDDRLLPEHFEILNKIASISDRMKGVTEMLLDIACLGEAEKSLISITDLANTVIDLEKLKIYDAGIALETDLQTTPMVLVEKNSMVQAFLHLLVNARHALIGRSKPLIKVSCGYESHKAFFRVEDNGCGISDEHRHKIFTPFFTLKGEHAVDGSSMGSVKGYGLGLSVSDSIVRHHGGELSLRSEFNEGSEFSITLPVNL